MSDFHPRPHEQARSVASPQPTPAEASCQAAEVLDSSDDSSVSGAGSGAGEAVSGTAGDFGALLLVGTVITACIFGLIYQLFSAAL